MTAHVHLRLPCTPGGTRRRLTVPRRLRSSSLDLRIGNTVTFTVHEHVGRPELGPGWSQNNGHSNKILESNLQPSYCEATTRSPSARCWCVLVCVGLVSGRCSRQLPTATVWTSRPRSGQLP